MVAFGEACHGLELFSFLHFFAEIDLRIFFSDHRASVERIDVVDVGLRASLESHFINVGLQVDKHELRGGHWNLPEINERHILYNNNIQA